MAQSATRARSRRLEVRTTEDERTLIDRAVAEAGTDITTFVVSHVTDAALRVLADRDRFVLLPAAARAWDAINAEPAREISGLRALMRRPSPFER